MKIHLVWPAPGSPALLEASEHGLKLAVDHDDCDDESLIGWADRLRLRASDGSECALKVTALDRRREFDALPAPSAGRRRATIHVELLGPLAPRPPRSVLVLSIFSGEELLRQNSVALVAPGHCLRLAFASDLHIAELWDRIGAAIARHTPDLEAIALHPSELLRRFVDEANLRARAGELDLVVLGGDLVDHVYVHPREEVGRGRRDTNLTLLLELIAPLEVPVFVIPGNHDFRLYPWRPRVYGLGSIGLDAAATRRVLRGANWWGWLPMAPSDLDALRTLDSSRDPLVHHRRLIAPSTDYHVDMRGMRLIFTNTGPDVVTRLRRLERQRFGLMLRSLPDSWVDPDSEGLHDHQMIAVQRALNGSAPSILFTHAPLLHPRPRRRREPFSMDPGEANGLRSQLRFDRELFATGHRGGVIFRNVSELVRTLTATERPTTVISGHVHKATAVQLDRASRVARIAEVRPPDDPDGTITMLTAPSLGHRRGARGEAPGYLLASFTDGRLTGLERRFLHR